MSRRGMVSQASSASRLVRNCQPGPPDVLQQPVVRPASCAASLRRRRRAASSAGAARPVSRPSSFMAALIGIGLVARPSMSRQSGNSLWCQLLRLGEVAARRRPRTSAIMSLGTMLPTTEITPRPPIDISGSVRLSSPLSTVRFGRPR